jgi:Mg2+ and Co2+ transporter CorA
MSSALLFERDRVAEVEDWASGLPRIGRSALLWIDLEQPTDVVLEELADRLELVEDTARRLRDTECRPLLADHGSYLHVAMVGLVDGASRETSRVDCLVSERWLVTVRETPLSVVDEFREVVAGSGETGKLDGLGMLADLLEWALASYLDSFEELEHDLEEIDARAMGGEVSSADEVVAALVEMRREVGRLRRALVSHREVVLALTRPELEAIASTDSAERFSALRKRLEEAVQASRDTRAAIVGSFDVVIATTGQRTNDVMKVLTLASVLLLPGALIAGILGMNFRLGFFQEPVNFWIVVGAIGAVAVTTLVVARMRRWI